MKRGRDDDAGEDVDMGEASESGEEYSYTDEEDSDLAVNRQSRPQNSAKRIRVVDIGASRLAPNSEQDQGVSEDGERDDVIGKESE
ncbi:hypothetical protein KIPB_011648, partial [Kipferlia bialata]|eukprot:g11648.t1